MARKQVPTIYFRRKREGRTDYKKRLKLLHAGKPRLVVRLSSKNVRAQIIQFQSEGDKILASAESKELQKQGWKYSRSNMPAAYLLGLLIGKKALENNVKEAILDKGLKGTIKGSKIFAVLKGAVDAGLNVPHSESILPIEDRLSGKHVAEYAKVLKGDKEAYEKAFGACLKNGANPEDIESSFNKIKESILNK